MIDCADIQALLARDRFCEKSDLGVKLATDCLYPSAEIVSVHVYRANGGYRVTDGGGCARIVLQHAKDEQALRAGLDEARKRHCVGIEAGTLVAECPSDDWLQAAVLAVANGAALAANVAIDHVSKRLQKSLISRVEEALARVVAPHRIGHEVDWRGQSGKVWKIDLAVVDAAKPLLLRAISPHPASISAAYTAFGDIGPLRTTRFCVFDKAIADEDQALVRQVSDLVPLRAVEPGTRQVLGLLN